MKILTISLSCLVLAAAAFADDKEPGAGSPEAIKMGKERVEECRKLFKEGKEDEAVVLGMGSVDVFVAPFPKTKSVPIGVITTPKHRVEIHINTGDGERAKKKPPITRPYSFVVYSIGDKPRYLYSLDFEHGHFQGELMSVALGRMKDGHINYGVFGLDVKFSEVKKRALEIIGKGVE